jgi:hypothetical protein
MCAASSTTGYSSSRRCSAARRAGRSTRPLIVIVTYAITAVFLAVGLLGFVPGVTTNYDTVAFAGHQSGALLFGVFAVSILHNLVHLAFGAVGLLMARTAARARMFLIGGGVIYLLLCIYGLVIDKSSGANVIPLNAADDWLHFGLGLGMITLGLILGKSVRRTAATA